MSDSDIDSAVVVLQRGGVVAHACEGVWGLACDPFNEQAVRRVLAIKKRPIEKGLILIGSSVRDFEAELSSLNPQQHERIVSSWPGPETWIVTSTRFPRWITGGRTSVAVRVPGIEQARTLAESFGGTLVSTSANVAGQEPATTEQEVEDSLGRDVNFVLQGSVSGRYGPSRIRDAVTGEVIR